MTKGVKNFSAHPLVAIVLAIAVLVAGILWYSSSQGRSARGRSPGKQPSHAGQQSKVSDQASRTVPASGQNDADVCPLGCRRDQCKFAAVSELTSAAFGDVIFRLRWGTLSSNALGLASRRSRLKPLLLARAYPHESFAYHRDVIETWKKIRSEEPERAEREVSWARESLIVLRELAGIQHPGAYELLYDLATANFGKLTRISMDCLGELPGCAKLRNLLIQQANQGNDGAAALLWLFPGDDQIKQALQALSQNPQASDAVRTAADAALIKLEGLSDIDTFAREALGGSEPADPGKVETAIRLIWAHQRLDLLPLLRRYADQARERILNDEPGLAQNVRREDFITCPEGLDGGVYDSAIIVLAELGSHMSPEERERLEYWGITRDAKSILRARFKEDIPE